MKGAPSRNIEPAPKDGAQRRIVPGPKSKTIFDLEAEAMAPGLQSIALYSQIAVDRAQGCTIFDVDGNEYLDFIAGIAVGSSTIQTTCVCVAPIPIAASRMRAGSG